MRQLLAPIGRLAEEANARHERDLRPMHVPGVSCVRQLFGCEYE